jgi:hypothetical protein
MTPLSLSPLPSLRKEEPSDSLIMEREGFVDEAVVMALMSGQLSNRSIPSSEFLALSSDDMDFAGWQLSPTLRTVSERDGDIMRRPSPPRLAAFSEEPGIGAPHCGAHRWWLAGLAGLLSTLVFSLLLLNLSSRPGSNIEAVVTRGMLKSVKPAPALKADSEKIAPELTEVSPTRP